MLKILPFDCLLPYDFISGLFVRTLVPLVVVGALLLAGRVQGRRGNEALSYLLTNGGVLLVFLVYVSKRDSNLRPLPVDLCLSCVIDVRILLWQPSITQTVFKFFQTKTFDGDYGEFLIADYSINTAGAAYAAITPFAVAMVFVWPVGVPCLIAALLWRNRAPLLEIRRRERLLGVGTVYDHDEWKAHVNEETRRRRESFAPDAKDEAEVDVEGYLWSLTESYRASAFYFEVLEYTLQKLTLVGVLCFIQPGSLEQLVIGLIVCFVYMAIVSCLMPFASNLDNLLACVTQFALFVSMLTAVIIEHGNTTTPQAVVDILMVSAFAPAILAIVLSVLLLLNELGCCSGREGLCIHRIERDDMVAI